MNMSKSPIEYGLIGHPLVHSFSQKYFTEKFSIEKINACYRNFDIEDISVITEIINNSNYLGGFNVTIPYKQKIITYLDSIDDAAKEIGAVNVVKISRNHGQTHLRGYNTDFIGFMESIKPLLKEHHSCALILGTGGASKAVAYGLKKLGLNLTFVSRNPQSGQIGYDNLTESEIRKNAVIVNCTPLGTFPNINTYPPIPYNLLTSKHLCFDLVYNPFLTKFLELSAMHDAGTINGAEMLKIQADEAWRIWNKD